MMNASPSTKRIIVSGYYGFDNFGDDLIMHVLVNKLKSWGAVPVVLSAEPEKTRRQYQVEAIQRVDLGAIHKAFQSATAFVSGGGGLFQDVTGPSSPLYYGGLIQLARWYRLPCAFFGQGIGPLQSKMGRWATQHAISQCSLIRIRDLNSLQWVHQHTRQRAQLMGDLVWAWQAPPMASDAQAGIGVSLRPWKSLTDAAIARLAQSLLGLERVHSQGVNLLDLHGGEDIVPLSKLEEALKPHGINCHWYMGSNAVNGIRQSHALIAMRFHALLVGARLDLPLIALSYDPKVSHLARLLHLEDVAVDKLETVLTTERLTTAFALPYQDVVQAQSQAALSALNDLRLWLGLEAGQP